MPFYSDDHISGCDRRTTDVLQKSGIVSTYTRRFFVDSRHASTYSPFDFVVRLGDDVTRNKFKNVRSIELKAATIPKVANEDYVILDIPEMKDSNIDSNVPDIHDGFAMCFFDNSSLNPGNVKVVDKIFNQKAEFSPPISVDRLSIKIKKHDGTLVSTSDTANAETVTLLFEVEFQMEGIRNLPTI